MKTPQAPILKLSSALGITTEVWFKREDKHKYGSQKGRSIPLLIHEQYDLGKTHFVISSSGNAALAAVRDPTRTAAARCTVAWLHPMPNA